MCDCEQRMDALESAVEELAETVQDQREEIDDLKAEQESYPPLSIRGDYDEDSIGVALADDLYLKDWNLGESLKKRAYEDDHLELEERVRALENDAVTETVEIDRDDMVPIERDMYDRQRGDHDLSGNRLRATYVFEEFENHSISEGGVLKLPSSQVKNIHREHGLDDNRNTIRRTMNMVAKHSANLPKDERDEDHDENLIKFKGGSSKNVLIASKKRWAEHMQEVHEGEGSDETESDVEDETADVWAAHEQAEPVTHPSDDRVATDGGSDETEVI